MVTEFHPEVASVASRENIVTFDSLPARARAIKATAFVFSDALSSALHERVQKLSKSDATVLIVGETGTGKELIAREIHRLSERKNKSFIGINCAALPEHLVESELFGHERGAFTGATSPKEGWFETANGGTLFLDEVGDLSLGTQTKMLRALQEREINRVGGRAPIPVDIGFLAATNANLEEAVRAGRFREDLYYRLNVAQLRLPPLRERPGDILPLAEHFLENYRVRLGIEAAVLSESAEVALTAYEWPGNIRELENVAHQSLLVMRGNVIQPIDLNLTGFRPIRDETTASKIPTSASEVTPDHTPELDRVITQILCAGGLTIFSKIEEAIVRNALLYSGHNQVQAAHLLGISRNVLRHRLKLYGLI